MSINFARVNKLAYYYPGKYAWGMERNYTAFDGHQLISRGAIRDVLLRTQSWVSAQPQSSVLVFQDQTGAVVDLDLRGGPDVLDQLADHPMIEPVKPTPEPVPRGRGRPRLGVVSREVSLLPRHWQWLKRQPKSASATLRLLIEERMKIAAKRDEARHRVHATYGAMSALAGDLPDFEEASRALFAQDADRLRQITADWPTDVREFVWRLYQPSQQDS